MSSPNQDPASNRNEPTGGFVPNQPQGYPGATPGYPQPGAPGYQAGQPPYQAAPPGYPQTPPPGYPQTPPPGFQAAPPGYPQTPQGWVPGMPVRRRRRVWVPLLIVGVVIVGGGVGTGLLGNKSDTVPLSSAPPSTTVTTQQYNAPLDLNQPFGNTPAAGWANGADGIVLPAAAPVGTWTAAQVADAENKVKQVLIAGNLDNRMLINHDPSAFLALLAPNARAKEQQYLDDPTSRDSTTVTQLAPGYHLLPAPIKVNGSMTADTDQDGNIVIHTNYVYAYPFAPTNPAAIHQSAEIVAIHHLEDDFTVAEGSDYAAGDQGVWPVSGQGYSAQIDCAAHKQGYLGPAYADKSNYSSSGPADTESPDALYDPNHSANVQTTC